MSLASTLGGGVVTEEVNEEAQSSSGDYDVMRVAVVGLVARNSATSATAHK